MLAMRWVVAYQAPSHRRVGERRVRCARRCAADPTALRSKLTDAQTATVRGRARLMARMARMARSRLIQILDIRSRLVTNALPAPG